MREQFYILKVEIVNDGRKGGGAHKQQGAGSFSGRAEVSGYASIPVVLFFADLLIHHLQHTGTIAGFGLIAMDDKIFVYLGTVIMEDVLCSV